MPTTLRTQGAPAEGKRTSRFRGVCWNKKNRRWQASINVGGKYLYLGSFQHEAEAAAAFDRQAYAVRLDRAKLNFPQNKARVPTVCDAALPFSFTTLSSSGWRRRTEHWWDVA